jgi:hypothetical protein
MTTSSPVRVAAVPAPAIIDTATAVANIIFLYGIETSS